MKFIVEFSQNNFEELLSEDLFSDLPEYFYKQYFYRNKKENKENKKLVKMNDISNDTYKIPLLKPSDFITKNNIYVPPKKSKIYYSDIKNSKIIVNKGSSSNYVSIAYRSPKSILDRKSWRTK